MCRLTAIILTALATPILADVVVYEGNGFPETLGWERQIYCTPQRNLNGNVLNISLDAPGECSRTGGDRDSYQRSINEFVGVSDFFFECRIATQGLSTKFPDVGPVSIAITGFEGTSYRFIVGQDQVEYFRDLALPSIFVPITVGEFHVFRLEHFGDRFFAAYVDGVEIDFGLPEGRYPSANAFSVMGFRSTITAHDSSLAYVRYGRIPDNSTGDFDSDGILSEFDVFYFNECLERAGDGEVAYPSCEWADMDGNGTVDCQDAADFETLYAGDPAQLVLSRCGSPVPAVSDWGLLVLVLALLSTGSITFRHARGGLTCIA